MSFGHKPHTITRTPQSLGWDSTDLNWTGPESGSTSSIECLVMPLDSDEMFAMGLGEFNSTIVRVYCDGDETMNVGDLFEWVAGNNGGDGRTYKVSDEPQLFRNPTDWSDSHMEFHAELQRRAGA